VDVAFSNLPIEQRKGTLLVDGNPFTLSFQAQFVTPYSLLRESFFCYTLAKPYQRRRTTRGTKTSRMIMKTIVSAVLVFSVLAGVAVTSANAAETI
jgi:hypothetical protein